MPNDMFAYFLKHHEISPVVFPMVDFDIIGRILKNKQKIRQCVKTSTTSGIRWQYAANGSGVPLTYVLYVVLRMKHWTMFIRTTMMICWDEELDKLQKTMEQLKTLPDLKNRFEAVLRYLHLGNVMVHVEPTNLPYHNMLRIAHQEHDKIGFNPFTKGFLSKKWSEVQNI